MSGHEGENATDAPPEAWEGADPPEVPRLTFQDEVESMEALIGMVLDQYEITALLGYGAMGCVYRVRHQLLGRDYALTLARWRERFLARRDEVRALGFDERFIRLWEFYLAYCEAAFCQGSTDVMQYTLRRA